MMLSMAADAKDFDVIPDTRRAIRNPAALDLYGLRVATARPPE
jgi:hypothetical protein